MTAWWVLLLASGGFALTNGIDVFTGLVWGKLNIFGAFTGTIDARFEPERFKRCFVQSLFLSAFPAVFFLVALLAILKSPQS